MDVSVRRIEEPLYDGTSGDQTGSNGVYQLGATIDGVFVPFVSKQAGYIDSLVSNGKAAQAAAAPATPEPTPEPTEPATEPAEPATSSETAA